ncbi:unnamed protein product [Moneuplotes crassus]|uniref:Uncharacterized protein n=1 Tax=Euplotes crassus TaxID=5936 RepID=A0AAD2CWW9_EUPCR|nr:unnamed protein product [Moneuplotes crassus]
MDDSKQESIKQPKDDNSKLVKEFQKMINEDEKLKQFAQEKFPDMIGKEAVKEETPADEKPEGDNEEQKKADKDLESIIDMRILDMLRLLEEYRKKCIHVDDDYVEAQRAEEKFKKTLNKATKKQRAQIQSFQEKELKSIEATQRQQFEEFSKAWDEYMADYEATAFLSLEKLKERQMKEYEEFKAKHDKEVKKKMKFSKDILDLRHKQEKLIKLQQYEKAEDLGEKADRLEKKERQKIEKQLKKQWVNSKNKLKASQEKALTALLKRIQRDKNEQLRQRHEDSQKLIKRNRNLVTNLLYKQNIETKKVIDQVEQTLRMTKMDKLFTPDMSRYKTALPCKRKKIK